MTIEQAIGKAIEGGWKDPLASVQHVRHEILYGHPYPVYALLLDPSWWQALGKAMGWGKLHQSESPKDDHYHLEDWRYHRHRFIDHLDEGKSIESWFEQLDTKS